MTDPTKDSSQCCYASLIDTHAHITFADFSNDFEDVLARAWAAGLEVIVAVGSGGGREDTQNAVRLAGKREKIFATVGIHPHEADKMDDEWLSEIADFAREPKVVAIGEAGLDYHHKLSPVEAQKKCFREMIRIAHKLGKPLVVHAREAHSDTLEIIKQEGTPKQGGVFHCFSGDVALARQVIDLGFLISVPGVVTFSNAKSLVEVVSEIPLEKIVIETDCPYLAPVPHRGKRNEPAYVAEVAAAIAKIKGLSISDVARVTTLNARRVFNLPGAELEPHIVYRIRNSLYLNITNHCNLACRFCPKFSDFEVKGYYLRLQKEPDVEQVFQAIGHPEGYDEVVFCGYGEPTLRLEMLKVIAARMKAKGAKRVRLNTDGLANLVYGRNVLPELKGIIDAVSVSLNAADAAVYVKNCPSRFGEKAYAAVCDFIVEAKKYIPEVVASVVALPELDIEACRKKADSLGVALRVREYMNVG